MGFFTPPMESPNMLTFALLIPPDERRPIKQRLTSLLLKIERESQNEDLQTKFGTSPSGTEN